MADLAWHHILAAQVAASSCQAVARQLGVSRTAVSLLVRGRYPGGTDRMAARVLEVFGKIYCPHLGQEIRHDVCTRQRMAEAPTSSPGALRWWRAYQQCPKPKEASWRAKNSPS